MQQGTTVISEVYWRTLSPVHHTSYIVENKIPARKHHISLNDLWCAKSNGYIYTLFLRSDCFCGIVIRVPGYRSRGPWFDSWCYQIFWEGVGLERGPLSLISTIEELLGRNRSQIRFRKSRIRPWNPFPLTIQHTLSATVGISFSDKWCSLGRYSSLTDSGHGV
jgi:hypothetical protein